MLSPGIGAISAPYLWKPAIWGARENLAPPGRERMQGAWHDPRTHPNPSDAVRARCMAREAWPELGGSGRSCESAEAGRICLSSGAARGARRGECGRAVDEAIAPAYRHANVHAAAHGAAHLPALMLTCGLRHSNGGAHLRKRGMKAIFSGDKKRHVG